jgi:hypothetical protein
MRSSRAAFIVVLVLPSVAAAFTDDELCRAIGETREAALQPRDRLFLEKSCVCFSSLGCAKRDSKQAKALKRRSDEIAAQLRAEEERRLAEEKAERERKVLAAAKRQDELCPRFVACLAQYKREEGPTSVCALLQNQIEDACVQGGWTVNDCAAKTRAILEHRQCESAR